MSWFIRLGVSALSAACVFSILALVTTKSDALDGILYEDLTCEELVAGYQFNIAVMQEMASIYTECKAYPQTDSPHHDLMCQFLKEHALFVQGIANDLADVYNIKCVQE